VNGTGWGVAIALAVAVAVPPAAGASRGSQVAIAGKTYPLAWRQWEAGGETHVGIGDTALLQRLGVELLNTSDWRQQPVRWFAPAPETLPTQRADARRYVAIESLVERAGGDLDLAGDTLELDINAPRLREIRLDGTERFVVELERPTFWHVEQGRDTATIDLAAIASEELLARVAADETGLLTASGEGDRTQLTVRLPERATFKIATLPNPPRIEFDLRPDSLPAREIQWTPGIWWRQQYVTLGEARFAVTWLEIDQLATDLAPRPFWSDPAQMTGIAPLQRFAQDAGAVAAINAGFFNRNTQLPLGAIRRDGIWYSGPILNRGAIAWNAAGELQFGRLRHFETLIAGDRRQSIPFLNSGYVQTGLARYTAAWGPTYTPLTDGEQIATVRRDRVTRQVAGGPAGQTPQPIPPDGYLLVARGGAALPASSFQLEPLTDPPAFAALPHAIGAGPLLVADGRVVLDAAAEQFSPAFQQQRASRSAIGKRAGGTLILAAFGDRVGGKGPSLSETAQLMQLLGAADALNLDGGSSASLYLGGQLVNRPPATAARVHNGIGIFLQP